MKPDQISPWHIPVGIHYMIHQNNEDTYYVRTTQKTANKILLHLDRQYTIGL